MQSIEARIATELAVGPQQVAAAVSLLDAGSTVPFIARYRKEATGNLDEVQIRAIQEKLEYFRELEDRRETVLATIEDEHPVLRIGGHASDVAVTPAWRQLLPVWDKLKRERR